MTSDDTRARFPSLKAGYESFFLRAVRPEGGLGCWIRYTVQCRPGRPATGALWFTLFDATAPAPLAVKVAVADPAAGGGDWIRLGAARLGDGAASGAIAVPGVGEVAWDLRFDGAPTLRHLPRDWMYRAALPRTKPLSPHPVARFGGTLTVDGRTFEVDGWPGMVGHNWGAQHAERWIWLHGAGFDGAGLDGAGLDGEGDGTWLDVTIGRIRVAGLTTPWVAAGAISLGGRRWPLGGPARVRATRVAEAPDHLEFVLPGAGITVSGQVRAPRERFVGWIYADPDGSRHDTVNCSIADLTVTATPEDGPPVTLGASGRAAYELGMRERDHGIALAPFTD